MMKSLTLISFSLLFCMGIFSPGANGQIQAQLLNQRIAGSPYPVSSTPDELYLTSENMSFSEKVAIQSLQGILAQTKPQILRDMYGHRALVQNNGIKTNNTYYNDFKGLLTRFSSELSGYILCDVKQSSMNVAASLSGILKAVAIPADIQQTAIDAGLTLTLDVRGKDETWMMNNYGSRFSKAIAGYQDIAGDKGLFLADYSSFAGAAHFWSSSPVSLLSNRVWAHLSEPNAAVLGWGPGEDNTVDALSRKNLMIHAADFAPNLSTLTNIPVDRIEQKDPAQPFHVEENVHTVCFLMSDGDNIQWLLGSSDNTKLWANPNRAKVNLGWTISPAMMELAPTMYKKYNDNMLTSVEGRNLLVAAPSGRGYFNPGIFPNLDKEATLLNNYMKLCDMRIANVIDIDNSPWKLEPFLKQDNIDALFYYNYSDYSAMHGNISWYKDKPAIAGRYDLWQGTLGISTDKDPAKLAQALNALSTDIHSPSSYSLIPVIVWYRNVNDVLETIGKLNPNIRVVAPDEFVWLLRKNLKNLPLGNGMGLHADYYKGGGFDSLSFSRTDKTIDLDTRGICPQQIKELSKDIFSVRWSGQLASVYSEKYIIRLTTNRPVRLRLGNRLLFDYGHSAILTVNSNPASSGSGLAVNGNVAIAGSDIGSKSSVPSTRSNIPASFSDTLITLTDTISLRAGEKLNLLFEIETAGDSTRCWLEWESPSQMRQTIPQIQFYSAKERPASVRSTVNAFRACDKIGYFQGLKPGNYNTDLLQALGLDSVSSLECMEGFRAVLYKEDNFKGDSLQISGDTSCLGEWNGQIRSIRILPNGVEGLSGNYFIKSSLTKYYVETAGGYTNTADGANIQIGNLTKYTNQQFNLKEIRNGLYEVSPVHSGKSLDLADAGSMDGTNIHQWTYYAQPTQQFILREDGNGGYYFVSADNGKLMESSNILIGSNVRLWSNTHQTKARWKLTQVPPLPEGTGNGLTGAYYSGTDFGNLLRTQIDPTINFNWGNYAPNSFVPSDNYSVRWTGQLQAQSTGNYTFYINSDNGRRLWINDQLIIDGWINNYDMEYSGNLNMTENQKYDFRLDYFESIGGAYCKLEWMNPLQGRSFIPKSQFYSFTSGLNNVLSDDLAEAGIAIYPMPVRQGKLNIHRLDNKENLLNVRIYTLTGLLCANFQTKNSGTFSLDALKAGTYLLSVQDEFRTYNSTIILL